MKKKNLFQDKNFLLVVLFSLFITLGLVTLKNQSFTYKTGVDKSPTVTPRIILKQQITLTGMVDCLPHKQTSGAVTLECVYGLRTDEGIYYSLDPHLIADSSLVGENALYATGDRIQAQGILTPVEEFSSIQKYDIQGVITLSERPLILEKY